MKRDTKKIILEAAKKLFNEQGYVNVRLHQIAAEANISVGNMAYHYKHKPEILLALFERLQEEQQELLNEISLTPIFENLDYFFQHTFEIQQNFLFFYQDTLELIRASEVLKQNYREYLNWQEMELEMLLQLNQARGAFEWEDDQVLFLAKQLRRQMDTWHYNREVEGNDGTDFEAYRKNLWTLLMPYFTTIGQKEFKQLEFTLTP